MLSIKNSSSASVRRLHALAALSVHPALLCLLLCAGLATPAASQRLSIQATDCTSSPTWGDHSTISKLKKLTEITTHKSGVSSICYAVKADQNVATHTEFKVKINRTSIPPACVNPLGSRDGVIPAGQGYSLYRVEVGCPAKTTGNVKYKENYEGKYGKITFTLIKPPGTTWTPDNPTTASVEVNLKAKKRVATLTLPHGKVQLLNGETTTVTITWDRPVPTAEFVIDDLSANNGNLGNFRSSSTSSSSTTYFVDLTAPASGHGTITVSLRADAVKPSNDVATLPTLPYAPPPPPPSKPSATVRFDPTHLANGDTTTATITWDRPVPTTGPEERIFTFADLTLWYPTPNEGFGQLFDFSGSSPTTYTVLLRAPDTGSGSMEIRVRAEAVEVVGVDPAFSRNDEFFLKGLTYGDDDDDDDGGGGGGGDDGGGGGGGGPTTGVIPSGGGGSSPGGGGDVTPTATSSPGDGGGGDSQETTSDGLLIVRGVSMANTTVVEGDFAHFIVRLAQAEADTVRLAWVTVSGTALVGIDYTGGRGLLRIPPGAITDTLLVRTRQDTQVEEDKQFTLRLKNARSERLDDDEPVEAICTIRDDDGEPSEEPEQPAQPAQPEEEPEESEPAQPISPFPIVRGVSMADTTVSEGGRARFIVRLAQAEADTVHLEWVTVSGTARAGQDYNPGKDVLSIPPGATTDTLSVRTLQDAQAEGDEFFTLRLKNARSERLDDDEPVEAICTIRDDEAEDATFEFAATVEDQAYTAGTAIAALVLPAATGGTGEVTYRALGLPAGLTFDAATRTISGTPAAATAGAVQIDYTAEDSTGATRVLTFSLVVNPPLSFGG